MKTIQSITEIPCTVNYEECLSHQVHSRTFSAFIKIQSKRYDEKNKKYVSIFTTQKLIFKEVNCEKIVQSAPKMYAFAMNLKYIYMKRQIATLSEKPYQYSFYKHKDLDIYYLIRPFKEGQTLSQLIRKHQSPQLFDMKYLQWYSKQLLSHLVSYQGLPSNIMTSNNIFVDQYRNMQFNFTSFVGLRFILMKQSISKFQFLQIYPYLDSKILKRDKQQRLNGLTQIRSLAVNLLKIITEQDMLFEFNLNDSIVDPTSQSCQKLLESLKQKFEDFLFQDHVNDKIEAAEKESGMKNLKKFFMKVLVQENNQVNYQYFIIQCLEMIVGQKHHEEKFWLKQIHQKFIKINPPSKNIQKLKLNTSSVYIPVISDYQFINFIKPQHWAISIHKKQASSNIYDIYKLCVKIIYKMANTKKDKEENNLKVQQRPFFDLAQYLIDSNMVVKLVERKIEYFHGKEIKQILNMHSDYKAYGKCLASSK